MVDDASRLRRSYGHCRLRTWDLAGREIRRTGVVRNEPARQVMAVLHRSWHGSPSVDVPVGTRRSALASSQGHNASSAPADYELHHPDEDASDGP